MTSPKDEIAETVGADSSGPAPAARDLRREIWALQCELAETRHALDAARAELDEMFDSRSWRMTKFLRTGLDGLRRLRSIGANRHRDPPCLRAAADFDTPAVRLGRPLLLVDVTELAVENLQGGIQHTVKGILSEWLLAAPTGWEVVPVQLTREGAYVSASAELRHLFGSFADRHKGRQIAAGRGDVFLGLDLLRDHAKTFRRALERLRAQGVRIEVVVYDLLPVDLPHCVPVRISDSFREWLSVVGDLADGALCISQAVAQRFESWLASRHGRRDGISIASFRLGVPQVSASDHWGERAASADGTSFLMVGTVEPRKGYVDALDAFERIWKSPDGANTTLTIVGRYGWGLPKFLARLESHPEMGRRLFWLRRATDENVQACYRSADALLFCSYGEGFGLPIVEAAQHGLPMILRDLPEFREVARDGAYFFHGRGGEAIEAAIGQWRELAREGRVPMPRADVAITWGQSAGQLLALIEASAKVNW